MVAVARIFRNRTPNEAGDYFRYGQIFAAAAYSLGHGGNDAQKTIGIIWLLLITAGVSTTDVATLPMWVVYACYGAIAWGTYLGGWRIVKTMGSKITRLTAVSGSCASMGGAISLGLAIVGGIPVSTTHTITGPLSASVPRKTEGRALGHHLQPGRGLGADDSRLGPDRRNLLVCRAQLPVALACQRSPNEHRPTGDPAMLNNVMPQRGAFFSLLIAHTDRLVAAANATLRLITGLGNPHVDIAALIDEVNLNETSADDLKDQLIHLLYESFTTPINRDQIHTLTMDLDSVFYSIQSVYNSIDTHHIADSPPGPRDGLLGADACIRLHHAVLALEGRERVQESRMPGSR
jgi:hypothetical protein